jgi:VIT1/CCC1 family predicted Fe2+/Mn2+ transporter
VSVSSQADTERADLARERRELETDLPAERGELASIYQQRGLDAELAAKVAEQLMASDALGAHARDELGISEMHAARPIQAAMASAATFAVGAAMPLLTVLIAPAAHTVAVVTVVSLLALSVLGAVAARAGGAPVVRATARVTFWGALAMALTAGAGAWFGAA